MILKASLVLLGLCFVAGSHASSGDRSAEFLTCVESCVPSGCVGETCIAGCGLGDGAGGDAGSKRVEEPWELRYMRWNCRSACEYECMVARERRKAEAGLEPEKYRGKWPFVRMFGLQEPASVVFSLLNLIAHAFGLAKFRSRVFSDLPRRTGGDKGPLYEYAGLWSIYGLLSINAWLWSAVFHSRDTHWTQALDYNSAIALLGFSFILAIIRTASLRLEAVRVMVSAPIIAFFSTHILYLNFYTFAYGWNMWVCLTVGVLQLLLWVIWATATRHPARVSVWLVAVGTLAATSLEVFDFPPLLGIFDAHSFWHLATIPMTLLWWRFVVVDAKHRTSVLTRAKATEGDVKKEK